MIPSSPLKLACVLTPIIYTYRVFIHINEDSMSSSLITKKKKIIKINLLKNF
jgi:hypothetical protein